MERDRLYAERFAAQERATASALAASQQSQATSLAWVGGIGGLLVAVVTLGFMAFNSKKQ